MHFRKPLNTKTVGAHHFFGSKWSGITNAKGYDTAAGYEAEFTSEKQNGFNAKIMEAHNISGSNWSGVTTATRGIGS